MDCRLDYCDRPRRNGNTDLCNAHYRQEKAGKPFKPVKDNGLKRAGEPEQCVTEDCDRPQYAKGLCKPCRQKGYYRTHRQKNGKLSRAESDLPIGGRLANPNADGYSLIKVSANPARYALEHRYVMEQKLGRPLFGDENVHHINGNRLDNRIENLELWSRKQPPGQRVIDKVTWAREILERYGTGNF